MLTVSAGPADLSGLKAPALAILLEQASSTPSIAGLDKAVADAVRRVIASRDFRGGKDEVQWVLGVEGGVERALLVGMGKVTDRRAAVRRAATIAARRAHQAGVARIAIHGGALAVDEVEAATLGAITGAWELKDYQLPVPEDDRRAPLTHAEIVGADATATRDGVRRGLAFGEGHSLARRLAMLPGNVCTPDYLADTARDIAKRHGMAVTVLGRAEMEKEKMGSLWPAGFFEYANSHRSKEVS